jgi:hypothetical protein
VGGILAGGTDRGIDGARVLGRGYWGDFWFVIWLKRNALVIRFVNCFVIYPISLVASRHGIRRAMQRCICLAGRELKGGSSTMGLTRVIEPTRKR